MDDAEARERGRRKSKDNEAVADNAVKDADEDNGESSNVDDEREKTPKNNTGWDNKAKVMNARDGRVEAECAVRERDAKERDDAPWRVHTEAEDERMNKDTGMDCGRNEDRMTDRARG